MNGEQKREGLSLNAFQIACVTAGVPVTGDKAMDAVIRQGLRFKTAAEVLSRMPQVQLTGDALPASAEQAVKVADALLAAFSKK